MAKIEIRFSGKVCTITESIGHVQGWSPWLVNLFSNIVKEM